eukprot:gene8651-6663_t
MPSSIQSLTDAARILDDRAIEPLEECLSPTPPATPHNGNVVRFDSIA